MVNEEVAGKLQYTVYSIQYTAYSIQYTAYSIQYTVYSIQHTVPDLTRVIKGQKFKGKKKTASYSVFELGNSIGRT